MKVELKTAIRVIDKRIEALKSKIAALSESRRILLDTKEKIEVAPIPREVPQRAHRRLSPKARQTIAAAQKKRWANYRAARAKVAGATA